MATARTTLLAVLCCVAGCQSVDRRNSNVDRLEAVDAMPANAERPITSFDSSWPDYGQSHLAVQPVVHIQSAQPVVQPESIVPLPAPRSDPLSADLTLAKLEEMAITANPAVAEARARVDAARGNWVQVGLPPNTQLGYSGQQLGSHGLAEQQGVFIQQEFVRGGKLRLNRAIALQEIERAEQHLATQQQRVLTDVRLGFYEVLIAQRRIEMTQQLSEIANQGITTANALFAAKEVSRIDVMRARIERQSAELLNKNARNLYIAAWSRLSAVLGDANIAITPLVGNLEAVAENLDQDATLQRLLSESPEIAVALTEVERSRRAIDRAYAEPVPNVDVQAVIQSDNGTGSSNANLQVSMPIPWLNRNQGGIRQAEANLFAAERAVSRLELSLKQRLASVYQQYASARNQVQDYTKPEGILANSKATLDFVQKGYQADESDYLDLLTAQRTFSQTNLAYIEALGELWSATVEIEGLLLKDSLASPE